MSEVLSATWSVRPNETEEVWENTRDLRCLIQQFSTEMLNKLISSEKKYGWKNAWIKDDWEADLRQDLIRHIEKGDPIDVAAYCAFAWFHKWTLATQGHRLLTNDEVRLHEFNDRALTDLQEACRINDASDERECPPDVWLESCGTSHIAFRLLAETVREITAERDTLRTALIAAGRAAGCLLNDAVSTGFLVKNVAGEVSAVRSKDGQRLADTENDRDALLDALGFHKGPLGTAREVVLMDASGLRQEMVKARREARKNAADSELFALLHDQSGLVGKLYQQKKDAEAKARELQASVDQLESVKTAAKALSEKLAEVEPHINSMIRIQYVRTGVQYSGPQYGVELEALRAEFGKDAKSAPSASAGEANPVEVGERALSLFPPLGDTSLHFEDALVMNALVGTDYLKNQVRGRLQLMTTGEKWSLYRAIVNLSRSSDALHN